MKENKTLHNLLLLTGIMGLLVLSLVFDLAIQTMAEQNAQSGSLGVTLVWLFPLMQLLWMLAVVGLVWYMVSGGWYSRWISAVFLLVGLFLLYTNPILYVNELPDSWYFLVQYLTPGTLLFQAGGAFTAIGLFSLWFWNSPTPEADLIELGEAAESEAQALETEALSEIRTNEP